MKEVIVAKSAGFCFGVSRSVKMAEELLEDGPAYSLGQLIHNDDVVVKLSESGLGVINSPEELPVGEKVMIRSHGVSKAVYDALESRNAVIIDATCPKVKKIHEIVSRATEEGRFVVIIGMHNHPEVEAVCGWCGAHILCENVSELEKWWENNPDIHDNAITMVIQTTQTRNNFTECANFLKKRCTNAEIFDTICGATSTRQDEASKLSAKCDAMVVIGGKHSANSVHLAEICRESCDNVQFINNADELDMDMLAAADTVGITAGASAPSWIIKEVSNKMSEEIKIDETAVEEKEMSFDEMLEESIKTIYNGDKVTGYVVAITGTEISVDIGTKYSGFIPTTEFTDDGIKVEDAVKVGDTIEAVVVRVNDVEGTVMLSKKRLDAAKSWNDVEEAAENGGVLEGVVTEENKGGIVVSVKGVRVFVPASQSGLPKEAEMSQLLKQKVRVKITEVNRSRKRVVGSIRAVAQKERRERAEAIWNEIEVGKKYHGTVKSMTSYGAFVDIGGIDGMVHVSEMSWNRIKNPAEVFAVGDEADVYVISFDKEKRKISLGYKNPEDNPWAKFMAAYEVGAVASVTIVKLMPFGAFAEVLPGVDGLIHISQIANRRIGKPEEVLAVGDVVEAKITAIDEEKQKISLSIRALAEPAPAEADEEVAEVTEE
ncbi:MAG: bifunctional 4-hydroxy-3-methylbut-2-enyl diphosphate reductase/30S ribosomal protein S1 [Bacillota bacterium]|nr:bifunctional 4-hydroxy-3-methylbut-2-enyl diphosphate reductase/30S ribosomal protein S1 [Bacillota bacterium]